MSQFYTDPNSEGGSNDISIQCGKSIYSFNPDSYIKYSEESSIKGNEEEEIIMSEQD